jgi:aspartate racemase
MKTIGLLGGMSWESSAEYYRVINREVQDRLGGSHSARSVMVSVDFQEIETMQQAGDWAAAAEALIATARQIEAAGADLMLICTNTMHLMFDAVQTAVEIPLIHIADATATAIASDELRRVGLLGTRYTMEMDFYRGRLQDHHGLEVIVPNEPDRTTVHDVIFNELVKGEINEASRQTHGGIIDRLLERGAEGIVLGCTELELLIDEQLRAIPLYPTARLHAIAAVDAAIADNP